MRLYARLHHLPKGTRVRLENCQTELAELREDTENRVRDKVEVLHQRFEHLKLQVEHFSNKQVINTKKHLL